MPLHWILSVKNPAVVCILSLWLTLCALCNREWVCPQSQLCTGACTVLEEATSN